MLDLETIKQMIKQRYSRSAVFALWLVFNCPGIYAFQDAMSTTGIQNPEVEAENMGEDPLQGVSFKSIKWDHNFAFTLGEARGAWNIDQFGPIQGKNFDSQAYFAKFQYTFHLPLAGSLGYTIGSSSGYYWERSRSQSFHSVSSLHFPGIHVGFVYSFTSFLRAEVAFESYLERLEKLQASAMSGVEEDHDPYQISITMRPHYDWILLSDFFYSESWGMRVEWHMRKIDVNPPSESTGQIIGARLTKRDTWIGLGLVYHLFSL